MSARVLIEAAQADSDGEDGAGAGYERNGHRSRIRTVIRIHFASPPRGQGTQGCQHVCTRDEAEPAHCRPRHPSRQSFGTARRIRKNVRSHLGSTLNPGGAVLTLGVFRRSRSVAYIPADASPSEVLASVIVPPTATGVNPTRGLSQQTNYLLSPTRLAIYRSIRTRPTCSSG